MSLNFNIGVSILGEYDGKIGEVPFGKRRQIIFIKTKMNFSLNALTILFLISFDSFEF